MSAGMNTESPCVECLFLIFKPLFNATFYNVDNLFLVGMFMEVVSVSGGEADFHSDDVFRACAFGAAEPTDGSPVEFVSFTVADAINFPFMTL